MRKFQLLTGVVVLLLVGCVGDRFDVDRISDDLDINTGLMLPVAHADVSVKDILSSQTDEILYYKDSDGDERVMIYQNRDSVESLGLGDFLSVDVASISIPVPLNQLNSGSFQLESGLNMMVENFILTAVKLKYAIEIEYRNFPKSVSLQVGFPSVLPVKREMSATLLNNGQHVLAFDGDFFQVVNHRIPVSFSLVKTNSSDVFPISGQGDITIRLTDTELLQATGSTTGFVLSSGMYNNLIDFSDFGRFKDNIWFDNPRIYFHFTNQTPLKGVVSPYMKGSRFEGSSVVIQGPAIAMDAAINGITARTTTVYDQANSNVAAFFNSLPEHLSYRGDFSLSMLSSASSITISNQDSIYLGYRAEIPAEFRLNSPIDVDTITIDDTDLFEDIQRGAFIVDSENSLPLEASLAIAFYDDDTQKIIDLIVCDQVIPSGKVNVQTGKSTASSVGKERIVLSEKNIDHLRKTEKLILQLQVKSAGYDAGQVVVLLASNRIQLKVSLVGDIEF